MKQAASTPIKQVVALFNASDDTVEMVQRMLDASGFSCLVGCHFADLKSGVVDFARYLDQHAPDVVIFDISPPYAENWHFFKGLRDGPAMRGRGLVLTTTNKERLDETVGLDSEAIEIVGTPYDLAQIQSAIDAALGQARQLTPSRREDTPDEMKAVAEKLVYDASTRLRKHAEDQRTRELVRVSAEYVRSGRLPGQLSQAQLRTLTDAVEQDLRQPSDTSALEERVARLETATRVLGEAVLAMTRTV